MLMHGGTEHGGPTWHICDVVCVALQYNTPCRELNGVRLTLSCLPIGTAAAALGAAVDRRKSLVLCPVLGPAAAAGVLPFDALFAAAFAAAAGAFFLAGGLCKSNRSNDQHTVVQVA